MLVKHTEGDNGQPVAWVSFKPYQDNTIKWDNRFAIYVSNSEMQSGVVIDKLSDQWGTAGMMHEFGDADCMAVAGVGDAAGQNTYMARNSLAETDAATLGLAQSVVVNGKEYDNNPINAVYVPTGEHTAMTPLEQIDIYLLDDVLDGTVMADLPNPAFTISYEEGEKEHCIIFDSSNNK